MVLKVYWIYNVRDNIKHARGKPISAEIKQYIIRHSASGFSTRSIAAGLKFSQSSVRTLFQHVMSININKDPRNPGKKALLTKTYRRQSWTKIDTSQDKQGHYKKCKWGNKKETITKIYSKLWLPILLPRTRSTLIWNSHIWNSLYFSFSKCVQSSPHKIQPFFVM